EMVFRERSLKLDGIFDALPVPTWVPLTAKLVALSIVIVLFMTVGVATTIAAQLYHHYTHIEPGLYVKGIATLLLPFLLSAVLAVALQVLTNNKFAGYLLMIFYLISRAVLAALHFDHNLYHYAGAPGAPYSDMNGYGHFVAPLLWFDLYWTL